MFKFLSSNATVKNVGIIDSFFQGNNFVAGICAENRGTIANCYNSGSINGSDFCGGVCAGNDEGSTITNCYNRGTVSGNTLGGVCGSSYGDITNCYYLENCNAEGTTFSNADGTSKTAEQFASGEVTYLLNGNQSDIHFYQDLSKETYPTLHAQSKVVVLLTMIYDESFEEDTTIKKIYCNVGDSVPLETSPDVKYVYQYFVEEKQIAENTYTVTGKTEITVKKIPIEIKLSDNVQETIQLTYQKKMSLDLTDTLKTLRI